MTAEDRVTAALNALAEQGTVDADGEGRLATRLRREHRRRRVAAVVGSIAVVVGVAAFAGTLGSAVPATGPTPAPFASFAVPSAKESPPEPSPSPSPYPRPAPGVGGPSSVMTVELQETYGVRDARTGSLITSGHPAGYTVTEVAAVGDGRTFYVASIKGNCGASAIQRVTLASGDQVAATAHDIPGAGGLKGEVTSMAVSADGTKLAYSIAGAFSPGYGSCGVYELRVLDLRTGATRTWTGGDATPSALNWAPDGRTLLLHVNPCCGDYDASVSRIDTQSSASMFTDGLRVPGTYDPSGCGVSSTASSAKEVFAVQECHGEEPSLRIVVLDPVTGRVIRRIATIAGVALVDSFVVTPDGAHALIAATGFDETQDLRVDDGNVSLLPTHVRRLVW